MIANGSMKLALVPLLIVAATWSSPSRLAQIRANRLTLTPVLGSSQSGIEPKVIEQRDFSGKVVARLRIMPGASAGEFQFEVEDFKQPIPARAVGSGKISDTEVRVRIVERASGTQLGLRAVVNGGRSPETRITLSLDRLSFTFVLDEKVRGLMNEVRKRAAGGASDADLIPLARQIDSALKVRTGYQPFIEHVRNSSAFDILTTTRSLIATVPGEEVGQHPALTVIRDASRFLAPSHRPASPSTVSSRVFRQVRIVKTAFNIWKVGHPAQAACTNPTSCTDYFWNCCIPVICAPLNILLEILCYTMCFVEWLACLP